MAKFLLCIIMLFSFPFDFYAKKKIVQVNQPYTYEALIDDLSALQKRYKREVKMLSIGKTHFGHDIWAVKLGKGKKNIVLIGTHHGREWLTSMLLMKMLESYAEAYRKEKNFGSYSTDLLDNVSIWFVPMLNPDGVMIQQNKVSPKQNVRLLEMNEGSNNFARWKANGKGVDLNRQYPAGWDTLEVEPNSPSHKFYKGKAPLEAKEVIALTQFVNKIKPAAAVAYHTAGREIFWKYKNGKYLKRDKEIAEKIANLTGYKLAEPAKEAVGGGFTDWFITTHHRPAMTIEISYLVGETNPPLSVFKTEWRHNKYVGLKLAKEAKKIRIN